MIKIKYYQKKKHTYLIKASLELALKYFRLVENIILDSSGIKQLRLITFFLFPQK